MSVTMDEGIKRWTAKRIEAVSAIFPSEPPRGAGCRDHPGQDYGGGGLSDL